MAKIYIKKEHGTDLEDAKIKVKKLVERFYEKNKPVISDIIWNEDETVCTAKSKFLKKGEFSITDKEVVCDLELTFMASAFKGKIEGYLEHKFKQAFGD